MNDKYEKLWAYIASCGEDRVTLSYAGVADQAGVPIDHSFLKYKKNLERYGWRVLKISMKEEKVLFERLKEK